MSDATGLPASENTSSAEDLAFDKADQAAALEKLRDVHGALQGKLKELGARLGDAPEEAKPRLEKARDSLAQRRDHLEETIRTWIPDDD